MRIQDHPVVGSRASLQFRLPLRRHLAGGVRNLHVLVRVVSVHYTALYAVNPSQVGLLVRAVNVQNVGKGPGVWQPVLAVEPGPEPVDVPVEGPAHNADPPEQHRVPHPVERGLKRGQHFAGKLGQVGVPEEGREGSGVEDVFGLLSRRVWKRSAGVVT